MLEKGVDYGPINRTKYVFPANAWHNPQLPAARLQLLGNYVLPGFPFLSLSIKCEGLVRLQARDSWAQALSGA
jgi:predicted cupin superfamily sugar epimerase